MIKAHYICSECGREYDINPENMVCQSCSSKQEKDKPLRGILDVVFDYNIDHNFDPLDLLPVEREYFPQMPVGDTPLWKPRNLREETGFQNLFIKDDTLNPTGSLKDRASLLVAGFALKHGIKNISVASTGNAGSSMAGLGAVSGLDTTVFVPKNAPEAKLIQVLQYGARLIPVDGDYDHAYQLSIEYSKRGNSLSRNTAYNPLTIEGKKTVALEIFRDLGKTPDIIFVPTGDGVILSAVYKGFLDLINGGVIDRMPTIFAVQSTGSDAICRALKTGDFGEAYPARTLADSICVAVPSNGYHVINLLKKFDGQCIGVTDNDILTSQKKLSMTTGLFAEPAAAASLAGFLAVKEKIPQDAVVVILVTGSGLKDLKAARENVEFPATAIDSIEEL